MKVKELVAAAEAFVVRNRTQDNRELMARTLGRIRLEARNSTTGADKGDHEITPDDVTRMMYNALLHPKSYV